MATIYLSTADIGEVCAVLGEFVQETDDTLGDCNNQEVRESLRARRAAIVRAIGELTVGLMAELRA